MQVNERERLDNAATQPFAIAASHKSQRPDEIAFHLSFSFSCSNSFKVLIGFILLLIVAWNLYSRDRSDTPEPTPSPAISPTNTPRN